MIQEKNEEEAESISFSSTKQSTEDRNNEIKEENQEINGKRNKIGIKIERDRYSPETKIIVSKYAQDNISKLAAERYSIPVSTIRRWLAHYNRLGASAFYEDKEFLPDLYYGIQPELAEKLDNIDNMDNRGNTRNIENIGNIGGNIGNIENSENISEVDNINIEDLNTENNVENNKYSKYNKYNKYTNNRIYTNNPPRTQTQPPNPPPEPIIPHSTTTWEKINLISPSLRLWAAKRALTTGRRETANTVGVNISTLNRWVFAYKTMGSRAHLFLCNRKRYSGADNQGDRKGVCVYSTMFKKDIIDKAMRETTFKVAYEAGISPDTITKWKKKLNYGGKEIDGIYLD